MSLVELEQRLGLSFSNKGLLEEALTHRSFSKQAGRRMADNERLEFFGDAVLKFVMTKVLYHRYPDYAEGDLTRLRSVYISDRTMGELGLRLGLSEFIRVSESERRQGGHQNLSLLCDVVEAIIGACYLDGGMEMAEGFLHEMMARYYDEIVSGQDVMDGKSRLQELLQEHGCALPKYEVIQTNGPEHDKSFTIAVTAEIQAVLWRAEGEGSSKKSAEQEAASALLHRFDAESVFT